MNKVRDALSAEGFAGYSAFQNLIVGGQDKHGMDATNDLSYICIQASMHTQLPMPSFSARVWNGSPTEFLVKCAQLTRTGIGLPAYYNDEVIIPSLMTRGLTLEDARDYNIIGCVEPQKSGKTEGWHDAAFFNMCRPLEMVFSNGMDEGVQIGPKTGDVTKMKTFDEVFDAYKKQMAYNIMLMVNADNAVDYAHRERCPLPYQSSMIADCIGRGKTIQEGGAIYNFTGPQGFGIANMTDALWAVKTLVFDEKKVSMKDLKEALLKNYGKGYTPDIAKKSTEQIVSTLVKEGKAVTEAQIEEIFKMFLEGVATKEEKQKYQKILDMIAEVPKYGNDNPEIDMFAREVAYTYTKEVEKYTNPRGGVYQAGLYPVSANVPLGHQTGATPDGRLANTPVADGVGPASGRDVLGPTSAANSVAKLDYDDCRDGISNTFSITPEALGKTEEVRIDNLVSILDGYFAKKAHHININVLNRETLIKAYENPEDYPNLTIRVSGYAVNFNKLSREQQREVISRTFHESV